MTDETTTLQMDPRAATTLEGQRVRLKTLHSACRMIKETLRKREHALKHSRKKLRELQRMTRRASRLYRLACVAHWFNNLFR